MESHKLAQRVEQLEGFLRFLTAAQTEIRYSAVDVAQIVQRHGSGLGFLRKCAQCCRDGWDFQSAWEEGLRSGAKGTGLTEKDLSILRRFGAGFGASDLEGQLSHCDLYAQLVNNSLESAREDKNRKGKLYFMLGSFSGVTVALLLC